MRYGRSSLRFDGQFDHYFGMSPEEYIAERGQKSFDNAVNEAGQEFWETMDWAPGAQALWSKIGKHGVTILSSPGEYQGAKEGKKAWIRNNLNPPPVGIVFRPSGQKHKEIMGKDKTEIKTQFDRRLLKKSRSLETIMMPKDQHSRKSSPKRRNSHEKPNHR
ncbi:hypothetical protein GHT06_007444 [Daphnia sinensis]|uniref:Uncharacterized protein n=1 Tax=Daphnia sinensis TaxID=1820382 RepID=A0AAD5PN16_9CRUS|nr:hypothetical protein GHT06_007444 [Daphnia sinensis]